MDLHILHQDIERGFVQLKDLDRFDRRRYLAWRLALRAVRGQQQRREQWQPTRRA